jgi:predicted solute-binding protein
LPFVYALWLVRPEVADPDQMAEKLRNLAEQNLRDVARLISDADDRDFCMRYYREHLRFSFGTEEKKGLELFHRLCAKYRLLPKSEFKLDLV